MVPRHLYEVWISVAPAIRHGPFPFRFHNFDPDPSGLTPVQTQLAQLELGTLLVSACKPSKPRRGLQSRPCSEYWECEHDLRFVDYVLSASSLKKRTHQTIQMKSRGISRHWNVRLLYVLDTRPLDMSPIHCCHILATKVQTP